MKNSNGDYFCYFVFMIAGIFGALFSLTLLFDFAQGFIFFVISAYMIIIGCFGCLALFDPV